MGRIDSEYRASIDPRLAMLAAKQHGVVGRRQLRELGLTSSGVQRRVDAGRLHSIHTGVYAVGHTATSRSGFLLAAVLACGPGALLSHASAAELWGLTGRRRGPIDVTVLTRGGRRLPGIAVHRVRRLDSADRTTEGRIPVTSIPRTMLDLAEAVEGAELRRAWDEADRMHLLKLKEVGDLCNRSHGRRGLKPVTALLDEAAAPEPSKSVLEARFLQLCRDAGLPAPQTNILIAGYEVDAIWPDARLIVELDGYAYHGSRKAFEHDRRKDAALLLAGYRVIRVTWRQLENDPEGVIATVAALYASGSEDVSSAGATSAAWTEHR